MSKKTLAERREKNSKALIPFGSFVAAMVMMSSLPAWAQPTARANNFIVDNDRVQCPTATFTEIQDAVTAAPAGTTIRVCAGVYTKQVTITKPLTIQGDTGAILQPLVNLPNATSFNTASPPTAIRALLLVMNTRNVSIDNLTVDGASSAPSGCGEDYVGVLYQNASGSLTNMAVRNIKLAAGSEGCQSGEAIYVQNVSTTQQVEISDCSVHDYQKTGILIDREGSNATVRHNYVTGLGLTPNIAQNGIQVSRGAFATVANNFVNNHLYGLCTPLACGATSTNILVLDTPTDAAIRNNTVGTAQIGIAVQANGVQVQNNDVYDNKVFDGIDLLGNNNRATSNNIFHSDSAGVLVEGNNNRVDGNTINEALNGVLVYGSGNQVNGNNKYYNVVIPSLTNPPSVGLAPVNGSVRSPKISPR